MLFMFRLFFTEDQDVVQVNYTCDIQELTKSLIYESLKGSRSISKFKRYSKIFK